MKKKIMAVIIGVSAAITLVGCGSGKISNDKITIEQYKGIEVEKAEAVKVTDEAVEQSIQSTLQSRSTQNEITDRAVKDGDVAEIDYVGKKDGVAFDGGTANDYPLTIGSGSFIPGFEEQIIGHKIGETFDINLSFPENYGNADLAGQPVVFTVTIKGIKEVVMPELTDKLVQELSGTAKTVAEYKKEVRADLKKSNEETAKSTLQGNVWDALMKKCEVKKYPEDKMKEMTDNVNNQYASMAQMYGMKSAEELIQQAYGMTIEELVKNSIKQEFAVELIAQKEKLELTDKDYKAGLKQYAKQYGYEDTAEFEKQVGKENLKKTLLQDKVTDWLIGNAKQVEKKQSKETK